MNTAPSFPTIPPLWRYGFLAMPLAFAGLPLYLIVPDLYARHFGLELATIAWALLLIRLIDAVQDPLIGDYSDYWVRHRLKIMGFGCALLMLGMAALFSGPPDLISVTLWFIVGMVMATTGFSVASINLATVGGLMPLFLQSRLNTCREGFALMGVLIAAIMPTALTTVVSIPQSHALMVVFMGFLVMMGLFIFSHWWRQFAHTESASVPFRENRHFALITWIAAPTFKPFRHFYGVYAISQWASSIPAVMVLFFISDYLGAGAWAGAYLLIYFLTGALGMLLWQRMANRLGALSAWRWGMLLGVLTFIGAMGLSPHSLHSQVLFMVICALSGLALGAELALPPALLSQLIDHTQQKSHATRCYAMLAFLAKLMLAIASAGALWVLDGIGFKPQYPNSSEVLRTVLWIYAAIPCLIKLGAYFYARALINTFSSSHFSFDINVNNRSHSCAPIFKEPLS